MRRRDRGSDAQRGGISRFLPPRRRSAFTRHITSQSHDWLLSRIRHGLAGAGRLRAQLGLDPDRWYATQHYSIGNYGPKPNKAPIRNSDPETYRRLADFIVNELGGQIVRFEHPAMSAFPPRPGFADLTRLANSYWLQAYPVTYSRLLNAEPSGPDRQSALSLASARLRHVADTRWSTKHYLNIQLLKRTDVEMQAA